MIALATHASLQIVTRLRNAHHSFPSPGRVGRGECRPASPTPTPTTSLAATPSPASEESVVSAR